MDFLNARKHLVVQAVQTEDKEILTNQHNLEDEGSREDVTSATAAIDAATSTTSTKETFHTHALREKEEHDAQ